MLPFAKGKTSQTTPPPPPPPPATGAGATCGTIQRESSADRPAMQLLAYDG